MTVLLPTVQARRVRQAIVDYLTTTFALTDVDAQDALARFLADPATGMFKGPYVRLRLPYRPAADGWDAVLDWSPPGFHPYEHQARAFARLSTKPGGSGADDSRAAAGLRRPEPTVVVTGTGSGKTEAFLVPLIDHVLRARAAGVIGTKALILYPMNALANDQAQRLTRWITDDPRLTGVTAALYTGQQGPTRVAVTSDGLITDRAIIRDTAPDLLLTNYKMLDQLLLRADDQPLWQQSATSLRYVVLDEFHTYDGAQGTDVAMLLRRLGIALKHWWPPADGDPAAGRITDADRARPLGIATPVATSATLGSGEDPAAMLDFARTVFGHDLGTDAVVGETRTTVAEWLASATEAVDKLALLPVDPVVIDARGVAETVEGLGDDPRGEQLAKVVLGALYASNSVALDRALAGPGDGGLLALLRAHPLVRALVDRSADARPLAELTVEALHDCGVSVALDAEDDPWVRLVEAVVATIGYVRSLVGRDAPSVETHLWVRELSRIDRTVDSVPTLRWSDDGPPAADAGDEAHRPSLPAVFCRFCGRSGWMVELAPVGWSLAADDSRIRRRKAQRNGRFRALLTAAAEGASADVDSDRRRNDVEGLAWYAVRDREIVMSRPDDEDPALRAGWLLPVLVLDGRDADQESHDDLCPSCRQRDGIRFVGSAVATLLSVSLSTLFGSPSIGTADKKALVFTDSVQDAAHRAGFVQSRSHALTLRATMRDALREVSSGIVDLPGLVGAMIARAGDDPFARYRLLAPDCADRPSFVSFWQATSQSAVPTRVLERARRRLALDVALELGLQSRTGRTLELTGSVTVEVALRQTGELVAIARELIDDFDIRPALDDEPALDAGGGSVSDATLAMWVRGVLDRMRAQGAINHPWFDQYRESDGNRWSIWRGRRQADGMPAFPRDRPAPAYPRVGGASGKTTDGLDPVGSPRSWYAIWSSRVLPVSPTDAARLVRRLLERLGRDGLLVTTDTVSGGAAFALPPTAVVVAPTTDDDLRDGRVLLSCDACGTTVPGSPTTVDELTGAPCMVLRCRGRFVRAVIEDGFYRQLYGSADLRRVVAREHTSLLDDATRVAYEDGFRGSATSPDMPNVLVATPTLELGIDIGDLSSVLLASLPRTVASYLQRVGRVGRLTGNALDLAYVTGRGEQLPRLGDPLSVINGEVRPPATYLGAEEILRRQLTASMVDAMARSGARRMPRRARDAIGSSEPGMFLGDLVASAENSPEHVVGRFTSTFEALPDDVVARLLVWVRAEAGPRTSPFAAHVRSASDRWNQTVELLTRRRATVAELLPELERRATNDATATDDDRRSFRSAKAVLRLTDGQLAELRSEFWIGVLEEYGLLPNYTLLDDRVTLDVGLGWTNPDTRDYETEHVQLHRASAIAIRELAPGATFYARGLRVEIDAVDLGVEGEGIRPWVVCPSCGWSTAVIVETTQQDLIERRPHHCPRCGTAKIADVGQRLDVVELTRVTAEVRRDDATISDRSDERERTPFQIVVQATAEPAQVGERWFVEATGFGCTWARELDLRWLNLGRPGQGVSRTMGGEEVQASLFRVCEGCGKLDSDTGLNRPHEHRPWCPYRTATEEHARTIALSRSLRTQGIFLRLPAAVTVGDDFAVPSLAAAVLVGLRERLGGHPDHLRVDRAVDAHLSDGSDNRDALVLHDTVPGGTGYLADLARPAELWSLLARAYEVVRDCPCRHEPRLACHRCLLPFVRSADVGQVSRAAAERHLRTVLELDVGADAPSEPTWVITDAASVDSPESHLEQRFRRHLLRRLRDAGAAVAETPGVWGNHAQITLPGSPRRWALVPQVNVHGTRPDFLLESSDQNLPRVAIFTDGRAYHAVPGRNRVADDAEQRSVLRQAG